MSARRSAGIHRLTPPTPLTVTLLVLLGLVARPLSTWAADDAEAEARRHFNRGKQLYDERRYREAAGEFEAGYAVVPKPGFLINIGHSYRRAGELKKAKRYYELYLEKDRGSPQRDEVAAHIKTIDEALADEDGEKPAAAVEPGHGARELRPPPAPEPTATAPVHVEARAEGSGREASESPLWPWLVSGAAVIIAGGIAAAVIITRPSRSDPCGTLGCLNER